MPLNADTNLWFPVAFLLTGRIFLLGFAWSWLMPSAEDRLGKWLIHSVQPLVFGIPVLLTIRLVSAEVFQLPAITPELIALLGLAGGLVLRRTKLIERIKACAAGFFIVSMTSTVIMHLPQRSEWVVGGWDPGIYVNEGVNLARLDTYKHQPDPFFSQLSEDELKVFTRIRLAYLEAHPVVPLDPDSRAIKRFFFPLTSTAIAEYAQAGGIRAATRLNYFFGLYAVLVFAAMLTTFGAKLPVTLLTTLCLVAQPVWLYHLNIPTSEMLQLFFIASLGLLLPHLRSHPTALFGFGHILLCAGMNRFGFLPFGTLLCCILALRDLGKVSFLNALKLRLVQLVPLWMAAGHCAFHNAITLERLGELTLTIFAAGGLFSVAALFIDFIGHRIGLGRLLTRLYDQRLILPITALALIAFVFIAKMDRSNIGMIAMGILNYISWPLLLLAAVGLILYFVGTPALDRQWFALITFLGCATVLVLLQSEIAPLMPWASRRLMMYTVPLVALLAGIVLQQLSRVNPLIPCAILLAALFINRARDWQAANTREYLGISAQLDAISGQIKPDDIVVSDHYVWSTPLRMMYGKNVINGEVLWREDSSDAHHHPIADRFAQGMKTLRRLQAEGHTIRFLASTEKMLTVYPGDIDATQDWQGPAIEYAILAHHKKAAGFKYNPRRKQFTLFTLNAP